MAFVVEDGTGLANATSYVSVEDASIYHADRGNTEWDNVADQQIALIRATQAVDAKGRLRFVGDKGTSTQALAWPRTDAVDTDGFEIASDELPVALINAVCEAALIEGGVQGTLQPALDRGGAVVEERVEGAVTVKYADGAPTGTVYTAYLDALQPILRGGGMMVVRV
jgi:hypothetical protein